MTAPVRVDVPAGLDTPLAQMPSDRLLKWIGNQIARVLGRELSAQVEAVVARSNERGLFLAISGDAADVDAARALLAVLSDTVTHAERIKDSEGVSDFYAIHTA